MWLSALSVILIVIVAGCASSKTEGGTSAGDLASLGFAGLSKLGAPIECNVKMTDSETSETLNMKLYLKGRNFRSEQSFEGPSPAGSEECDKLISILNHAERKAYIGCDTPPPKDECQWLSFEIPEEAAKEMEKDAESTAGVSEEELKNLPADSFSCKPAVFGDEKFRVTEGKVCDFAQMMAKAFSGTPEEGTETTIQEEGY